MSGEQGPKSMIFIDWLKEFGMAFSGCRVLQLEANNAPEIENLDFEEAIYHCLLSRNQAF